jgi:ATP-dependent exoDNAse (exonuclease V) beta subunit
MGINTLNTQSFPHIITTRSSAGTGKTYALALRYLTLIARKGSLPEETDPAISRIVAITFTNKAAKEMRTRIMDWMKRVTLGIPFEGSGSDPIKDIVKDAPLSSKAYEDDPNFEHLKVWVRDRIKRKP